MMSTPTTPRRWFHYSLRTLFVVVTLFALWLGWELKFIRDRRSFLKSMDELRDAEMTQAATGLTVAFGGLGWTFQGAPAVDVRIPFWRRWRGDEAQIGLILPRSSTDADMENAKRLFAEAIDDKAQ
jgi:hypothetical protein